jgi:hypothetical protein
MLRELRATDSDASLWMTLLFLVEIPARGAGEEEQVCAMQVPRFALDDS